jgi:hypothetical protein
MPRLPWLLWLLRRQRLFLLGMPRVLWWVLWLLGQLLRLLGQLLRLLG